MFAYLHGLPELGATLTPKLDLVGRELPCRKASESPARIRLPITPPILRQIRALWSGIADNFDTTRLWAASLPCVFEFFRVGRSQLHQTLALTLRFTLV